MNVSNRVLSAISQFKISTCVLALLIHKGYFIVKKLMGNVRIKAFWYTKPILINFLVGPLMLDIYKIQKFAL